MKEWVDLIQISTGGREGLHSCLGSRLRGVRRYTGQCNAGREGVVGRGGQALGAGDQLHRVHLPTAHVHRHRGGPVRQ